MIKLDFSKFPDSETYQDSQKRFAKFASFMEKHGIGVTEFTPVEQNPSAVGLDGRHHYKMVLACQDKSVTLYDSKQAPVEFDPVKELIILGLSGMALERGQEPAFDYIAKNNELVINLLGWKVYKEMLKCTSEFIDQDCKAARYFFRKDREKNEPE